MHNASLSTLSNHPSVPKDLREGSTVYVRDFRPGDLVWKEGVVQRERGPNLCKVVVKAATWIKHRNQSRKRYADFIDEIGEKFPLILDVFSVLNPCAPTNAAGMNPLPRRWLDRPGGSRYIHEVQCIGNFRRSDVVDDGVSNLFDVSHFNSIVIFL